MVTRRSMMERELSHQMLRARHDTPQRLKDEMHESLCKSFDPRSIDSWRIKFAFSNDWSFI